METHDITSRVARVEATDADPQVFKWLINLFGAMSGGCYFGVSNLDYILTCYIHFAFQEPHNEIRYSIVGNALAQEYFVIDSETGEIFQRKTIQLEPTLSKVYRV